MKYQTDGNRARDVRPPNRPQSSTSAAGRWWLARRAVASLTYLLQGERRT
jgi:hypothetical protein